MKRLLIFMAMALTFSVGAMAQTVPTGGDYLEYSHGELYLNGMKLSSSDVLAVVGDEIYRETYVGASRQRRTGMTLIRVGAPVAAGGAALMFGGLIVSASAGNTVSQWPAYNGQSPYGYYDYGYSSNATAAAGFAIFSLGALAMTAGLTACEIGIPLSIIGSSRMRWIANDFNEKASSSGPELTFGAQQYGVGLALKF